MFKRFRHIFIFMLIMLLMTMVGCKDKNEIVNNEVDESINNEEKSLESLEKVDDHPLYVMTYYGDYGFDDFLESRHPKQAFNNGKSDQWACSCFAALDKEGDMIFGRNFDWHYSPKLLLFTNPPNHYASVSMVDISYLGFKKDEDIANASPEKLRNLLEAPYLPFDGMNEYGLTVGEMTARGTKASKDPNKGTLGANTCMRLVLDYAQNVDEAIALLNQYNIDFPPAPPLHYQIADAEGNSAVIEFIDEEMQVIRNTKPWQVSTNFLIYNSDKDSIFCSRYKKAMKFLEEKKGRICEKEAMNLLSDISQGSTQWSIVYNISTGDIKVAMGREYDNIKEYKLSMKKENK